MAARILLVDDEPNILSALTRMIRRAGSWSQDLKISACASPFDALAQAQEFHYALTISDYRMPGMNGTEFLSRLRLMQPDGERVILSGFTDQVGLIGAINEAQIARFLTKPWNESELLTTIQELLLRRERLRQDQQLADQERLSQGQLSPQEAELRRLERLEPGITHVDRDANGIAILA